MENDNKDKKTKEQDYRENFSLHDQVLKSIATMKRMKEEKIKKQQEQELKQKNNHQEKDKK